MDNATAKSRKVRLDQGKAWIIAVLVAVTLNLLFFGLMPNLMSRVMEKNTPRTMTDPVQVTRIKPPQPEQPPRETSRQVQQTTAQRPTQAAPDYVSPLTPRPDISPLPLELNSALPTTSVAVPAPEFAAVTLPAMEFQGPFGEGDLDSPIMEISAIEPVYPLRARRMGIEGTVKVRFTLTKEGKIRDVAILEADPKGVFEASTLRAVHIWKLKPGTRNGKPADSTLVRTITFQQGG